MQVSTNTYRRALDRRFLGALALSSALMLVAGCHSKPAGPDPAQANMAPANGQTQVLGQNVAYSPQQQGENYPQQQAQYPQQYQQQAPAPVEQNYPQQQGYYAQQPGSYYPSDTEQAGEEALEDTTQAPPPLPDYDQPEAPGPDYIWTPGYWAWGQAGYYWVPGAWVLPPYYGALWTPPYWAWYDGRYRFHHGYWGRHVGYYGGIDYGFGYIGIGYFGGYWNGDHFYYNTAVTRVRPDVRTIYERPVVYNNTRYGVQPSNRVSYNGGHGGIDVQPRPTELAAMHEAHTAALPAQRQVRVDASQNRTQFYNDNHGSPAMASSARPVAANHAIAPPPRVVEQPARPTPEVRPGQPNGAYMNGGHPQPQPYGGNSRYDNRMQPQPNQPYAGNPRYDNRMQPQPNAGNPRYDNRMQPQPQPQPQPNAPRYDNRMQPQPNAANPRFENHGQPKPNAPRYENRAQPQPQPQPNAPRFEHQPSPQPQPRVENRPPQPQPQPNAPRFEHQPSPQPQPRAENHPQPQPQPQPRVENRPQPQPQPQPRVENRPQPQPQRMQAPQPPNRPEPQPQARPQGPPPQQPHAAPQQAHPAPQQQQQPQRGNGNGHEEHGHR